MISVTRKIVLAFLIITLGALWAEPATLTVYVAPPQDGLALEVIERPNREEIQIPLKEKQANRQVFVLDDSFFLSRTRDSPFLILDLVAFKAASEESIEQIRVRIPSKANSKNFVKLFLTDPKLTPEAIERFQGRGLRGEGAYRTYFEARKLFRGVRSQSPRHPLIVPAAFWFFSSAYELARYPESVIAMDEEAIEISRDVLARARTDKQMAQGFMRYSIDRAHWEGMIGKAERLEWRYFSLVQKNAAQGNFGDAAALNDYFSQMFQQLDSRTRAAVTEEYGVDRKLLANNAKFLAAKDHI